MAHSGLIPKLPFQSRSSWVTDQLWSPSRGSEVMLADNHSLDVDKGRVSWQAMLLRPTSEGTGGCRGGGHLEWFESFLVCWT